MHTKTIIPAVLMALTLAVFNACGSKDAAKNETLKAPRAAVIEDSKAAVKEDVTNTYDLKIGDRTYNVAIHRYSDTARETFKDEFGDEFYDNRVAITIRRDTLTVANREFSLESFDSYIPAKYKGKVILQGIACDEQKSTASGIVFGVSIGEAGTDEMRVALMLTIVPGSGDIDIRRDDTPDTIGQDQGKGER